MPIVQLSGLFDTPSYSTADFQADASAVLAREAAKYVPTLTNAALYKLVAADLDRALKLQEAAHAFPVDPPELLALIDAAVDDLRAVRNAAKLQYSSFPNETSRNVEAAREAAQDVLRYWAARTGRTLGASNAKAEMVRALVNTPRDLLGEVLGLPSWFLPVALGVAGLVVLAQVTGVLRQLVPQAR